MIQSLFFGILSSAVVAILYGVFIAQREDKIRRSLARVKSVWMRRRIMRALIDAAQGGSVPRDSGHVAVILLCFVLAFAWGSWIQSWGLGRVLASAQATLNDTASGDGRSLGDLKQLHAQYQNELSGFIGQGYLYLGAGYTIAIMLYFVGILGLFFWYPRVRLRASLHYDLSRLALRICSICSASEASQLLLTELAVRDEPSLCDYLCTLRRVAMAHGVNSDYYLFAFQDQEFGRDISSENGTKVSI